MKPATITAGPGMTAIMAQIGRMAKNLTSSIQQYVNFYSTILTPLRLNLSPLTTLVMAGSGITPRGL